MKKNITIAIALFFSVSLFAQIPNGSFESWTMTGYFTPDGWDNPNSMTTSTSTYTCMKGTPGAQGSSYLKLVSKTVSGMGVVPGIATCGALDMTNVNAPVPASGFAFTQRPQSLNGKWQYMAYNGDQGFINVMLTKWNATAMKRDTIATAMNMLAGMAMSWADFSINLTYNSMSFPDTAFITLSSSGSNPSANSYLYADTLHFVGSVAGTTGIADNTITNISVFPNPASDVLKIQFTSLQNEKNTVQLINVLGAVVRDINVVEITGTKELDLNIADLSKGVYRVRVSSAQSTFTKHIVIQ